MWFINLMAGILPAYRAAQDAQNGLPNQGEQLQHYLTCLIIDKARRDRERHNTQP
jgi:hypothetical protein